MTLRRSLIAVVLLFGGAWIGLWWLEHRHAQQPYSLIEDRLYVGSFVRNPPPGTRAVVNVCEMEGPYRAPAHLWEPIDGAAEPGLEWLKRVVDFIDAQRRAGAVTYVHCLAGMNRSGMVVTAYLMYEHRWSRDRALEFVRSKRSEVQPNPTMMRLLAEWEQHLNHIERANERGQLGRARKHILDVDIK